MSAIPPKFLSFICACTIYLPGFAPAKDLSFKDPIGTTVVVGKILSSLVLDTIALRQLPTSENPLYLWSINREIYNCKSKSKLSLYRKYWLGASEPTETFTPGSTLGIQEAIFPSVLSIKGAPIERLEAGLIIATQNGCKNPPRDWQEPIYIVENSKGGKKYGESKVYALTPARLTAIGDEREAWAEISLIDVKPTIDAKLAAELNISEDTIGTKRELNRVKTRIKYVIKCTKMQMAIRQSIEYKDDGTTQSLMNNEKPQESDFSEVVPGSVGEGFAEFVCSL
jgi:hypothetical protein